MKCNKERDKFFTAGIIFVVVPFIAIFIIPFFFLIAPFFFLNGIVSIWVSKQKASTKLFWTVAPLSSFVLLLAIIYQLDKMESETYLIHKDFRGKFVVFFEENCGVDARYENGSRVYNIPFDGVLITKFKREFGTINDEFYLLDDEGNKTKLPELDARDFNFKERLTETESEPPRDKLAVFRSNFDGIRGKGRAFTIGTYQELEDNFSGSKFYIEFEKKAEKKLRQCRGN